MYEKAIEVLSIFNQHGYLAYIVGGYTRDMLLGITTTDIDICTNAKPKDIIRLFDASLIGDLKYGSVKIKYKNCLFDVTTFRKDIKYENNRTPSKIKYIDDLYEDLLRRDFTVNTICIDKDGNIIDLLNGNKDIQNRLIRCVGSASVKLEEDSLRILRAIRLATILDFEIEEVTKNCIIEKGYLIKNLSFDRKREELNKIFSSKNKEKGRRLLVELKLDRYLGIDNLENIVMCDDILGIWSQLEYSQGYIFSKINKDMINSIKNMIREGINKYSVYKYGLYVSTVVGSIKGVEYKEINDIYKTLAIYSKKDICVNGIDIANKLGRKPGEYLKEITCDIEKKIVMGEISNNKEDILEYVVNNY